MVVLRYRLAIAGVIAATAVALPAVALASGPGSPAGTSARPQAPAASASKSDVAQSPLTGLAEKKRAEAARQPRPTTLSWGRALAARLGVSASAGQRAFAQISALSGRTGVDPASSAFAGIARGLGVSPARVAAALDAVKQSQAGR